jgi:hypothetical protein
LTVDAGLILALFVAIVVLVVTLLLIDGRRRPTAPIKGDQYVGERLARLRKLQGVQANGHRDEQARNAIKRGW